MRRDLRIPGLRAWILRPDGHRQPQFQVHGMLTMAWHRPQARSPDSAISPKFKRAPEKLTSCSPAQFRLLSHLQQAG